MNLTGGEFFSVSESNFVLDTVKVAEEARKVSGHIDVVIRLYEAYGGRGVAKISTPFKIKEAKLCNVLEDAEEGSVLDPEGSSLVVPFGPFKIVTVRLLVEATRRFVAGVSGLGIAAFAGLHLGGHLLAPVAGPGVANSFLFGVRELYQSPLVETALVVGLVTHSVAGSAAVQQTIKLKQRVTAFRGAGVFLMFAVPTHVIATRIVPWLFDTHVDLRYIRDSMVDKVHPKLSLLFYPYYIFLGAAGLYHGIVGCVSGVRIVFSLKPSPVSFSPTAASSANARTIIAVVSVVVMVASIFAIVGPSAVDPDWDFKDTHTAQIWHASTSERNLTGNSRKYHNYYSNSSQPLAMISSTNLFLAIFSLFTAVVVQAAPAPVPAPEANPVFNLNHIKLSRVPKSVTWNGHYNDYFDDNVRGHKTAAQYTGDGSQCSDAAPAYCTLPDKNGASFFVQCHRHHWVQLQCDYGFSCATDPISGHPYCASAGHP
ncbi:hypothetical protein HK100_006050 [Physocladia obscura]|uniref:Glycosyl hydrolases family 38 C-terminal domain-containing protein n=1 Tax=Physocladia obscura TaxID=109957 RepID=A0AAD5X7Q6_9FUNG|nr:hypothetical protein HK100_006050 [Physocladia obscura]